MIIYFKIGLFPLQNIPVGLEAPAVITLKLPTPNLYISGRNATTFGNKSALGLGMTLALYWSNTIMNLTLEDLTMQARGKWVNVSCLTNLPIDLSGTTPEDIYIGTSTAAPLPQERQIFFSQKIMSCLLCAHLNTV